jgi:hypothetical protein
MTGKKVAPSETFYDVVRVFHDGLGDTDIYHGFDLDSANLAYDRLLYCYGSKSSSSYHYELRAVKSGSSSVLRSSLHLKG